MTRDRRVAADWLQQFQPSPDAAVAFGDRHALDPANAEFELSSFYDWAAPSVSGEGENPVCRCLAFVPDSEAGRTLATLVDALDRSPKPEIRFAGEQEFAFVRVQSHERFASLAPRWLAKEKPLYDAACQGRSTPRIFPE